MSVDQALAVLAASPDHRVLRRAVLPSAADHHGPRKRAVFIDTETTGFDAASEKIIELALVPFDFCPETGRILAILPGQGWLQDPGKPIPAQITDLTGITDDMVAGKTIDPLDVEAALADAVLVIAHNAKFDRIFVEKQWPIFARKPWACSNEQIPWIEEGLGSRKLDYILFKHGLFHDGHRAQADCEAGILALSMPLPSTGSFAMLQLLAAARQRHIRISAVNAPYAVKDKLAARGYRWNDGAKPGRHKAWWIEIPESDLDAQMRFLRDDIYCGSTDAVIAELVTATERFTDRVRAYRPAPPAAPQAGIDGAGAAPCP